MIGKIPTWWENSDRGNRKTAGKIPLWWEISLSGRKKVFRCMDHLVLRHPSYMRGTTYPFSLSEGLTLISGTQTGCRRLDLYIEQKKFLACGTEFSVEFSAPPEFSGGVTEKYLSTGWARTFDLQITKQILYHCATAPLYLKSYNIYVLFTRIFRPFL
jgi:hypothetical protein